MNKIEEFAIAMSDNLYTMRTEDSFCNDLFTPNTGDSVPDEFKEFTIDNKEHSEKMKEIISNDIVNHLTQCPDDYKNEQGEYEYQPDVYDFAYVVDSYIEQLYEDTHCTKTVLVCTNCNSDNVQTKMWVKANTKEVLDSAGDDSDEDSWCEDCQGHHDLETKTMIPRKKVIGFQVEDANGTHIMHPDMDASFCVYNLSQAIEMIKSDNNDYWKLLTIWTDDIENPTMMFEGNVR